MIQKETLSISWSDPITRKNIPPGSFFVRGKQTKSIYLATAQKTKGNSYYHLSIPLNSSVNLETDYKLYKMFTWETCYLVQNLKLTTFVTSIII
jgi:hypothetical protein